MDFSYPALLYNFQSTFWIVLQKPAGGLISCCLAPYLMVAAWCWELGKPLLLIQVAALLQDNWIKSLFSLCPADSVLFLCYQLISNCWSNELLFPGSLTLVDIRDSQSFPIFHLWRPPTICVTIIYPVSTQKTVTGSRKLIGSPGFDNILDPNLYFLRAIRPFSTESGYKQYRATQVDHIHGLVRNQEKLFCHKGKPPSVAFAPILSS